MEDTQLIRLSILARISHRPVDELHNPVLIHVGVHKAQRCDGATLREQGNTRTQEHRHYVHNVFIHSAELANGVYALRSAKEPDSRPAMTYP